MNPSNMNMIVVEAEGEFAHLAFEGRLDTSGVGAIETKFSAMTGSSRRSMIVDLAEVTFVASMGIRIFVSAAKSLGRRGGRLVLLNARPAVRESLESTGIDQMIPLVDSLAEARRLTRS